MYFEVVGVVVSRIVVVPSDEVGTAFANEMMSIITADDRCRTFEDYINSRCDFAPDLWASSPQQLTKSENNQCS